MENLKQLELMREMARQIKQLTEAHAIICLANDLLSKQSSQIRADYNKLNLYVHGDLAKEMNAHKKQIEENRRHHNRLDMEFRGCRPEEEAEKAEAQDLGRAEAKGHKLGYKEGLAAGIATANEEKKHMERLLEYYKKKGVVPELKPKEVGTGRYGQTEIKSKSKS